MTTTKSVRARCREILDAHNVGDHIVRREEREFLHKEVLDKHPHREEKIGRGIHSFCVSSNQFGKKCFTILRVDNTATALGFSPKVGKKDKVKEAARTAVKDTIIAFRNARTNNYRCDLCKIPLSRNYGHDERASHVHHACNTFDEIYDNWREFNPTIDLTTEQPPNEPAHAPVRFAKPETAASFKKAHDELALLELVCTSCHKKEGKKWRM